MTRLSITVTIPSWSKRLLEVVVVGFRTGIHPTTTIIIIINTATLFNAGLFRVISEEIFRIHRVAEQCSRCGMDGQVAEGSQTISLV